MSVPEEPAEPPPEAIATPAVEPIKAEAEVVSPSPPPPRPRRSVAGPVLGVVGFLILAGAIAWLWRHPPVPAPNAAQTQALAALEHQAATTTTEVQGLAQRVTALAARKPPALPKPVDLAPIEQRLTALENRSAPTPAPPADMATKADLAALGAQIDAIKHTQDAIAGLGKRVDALTQQAQTRASDLAALGTRIDALARAQSDTAALAKQVDALAQGAQAQAGDLASLKQSLATLQAGAARIERLGRLQVAAAALEAGKPLGSIPDAPPALTRYAAAAPPTAAALRLSFPAAASAAARASEPNEGGKPLLTRVWARVRDVVTVRQGNRVVVGNAASDTLAAAQSALDAGDLAAAVAQLSKLQGAAASAIAPWLAQARALLAARAAIVEMEAQA